MKFAVVIPTYNAAEFIGRTLNSVLTQTVPPDEIIVADDGSKDGTVEIARSILAGQHHQVIALGNNSGGPATPMNIGIDRTAADWIVALDHDDELVPDRIERLRRLIQSMTACRLVIGQLITRPESHSRAHLLEAAWKKVLAMTGEGELTLISSDRAQEACILHGCFAMSCSAMAFPKSAWKAIGGFDASVTACIDFAFLEAATRDAPLGVIHAPVAYWTWSERNLSHQTQRRVFDVSTIMDRIRLKEPSSQARALQRRARLDRAYYLTCRGRYREAYHLLRAHGLQATATAAKCLAKALWRNFPGTRSVY